MRPSSSGFTAERFAAIAATVRSIHFTGKLWWLLNISRIVCKITTKITILHSPVSLSLSNFFDVWIDCLVSEYHFDWFTNGQRHTQILKWTTRTNTNAHSRRVRFNLETGSYLHIHKWPLSYYMHRAIIESVISNICIPTYHFSFTFFAFSFICFFFYFGLVFCIGSMHSVLHALLKLNHTKFHVFHSGHE